MQSCRREGGPPGSDAPHGNQSPMDAERRNEDEFGLDKLSPELYDLYKLARRCNLEMTEEQMDALLYVTLFNIEARYEEYKREFHKKCTEDFTEKNIKKIEELRIWLLEKIKN